MNPRDSRRGVIGGMVAALLISGLAFFLAARVQPLGFPMTLSPRLQIASLSAIAPTFTLVICIMRLARHRFETPQDLDGGGLTTNSERANLLQTLIQNTLEQLAIALPTYTAWSILAPDHLVHLAPASSILFLCGRILFFFGYRHGASGRAFGFALTFYPTVGLLIWTTVLAIQRLA
ncbi:hypothetical protein FHT08_000274 [Xanthomonas campestris]|uniref:MAPEG family protein n=1 Tax=Xanthomonas sp. CFBP 8151 TaxID=3035310 RepID=UPI001FB9711A|nr:MAPEG family protein [Xanthomonas sp. CFBP 8151]NIJ75226.1 hypothetical protein [Xanthomonas sp. CFBP 8151]